jgi:lipoprotein signal peptidase
MQRRFGIADFLITLGAVRLTEKFFLKGSSATDEEE